MAGETSGRTQFIGPHRHRRQRRGAVCSGSHCQRQRTLKGLPHSQQLGPRGVQQRWETRVYAGPIAVLRQLVGLSLPVRDVGTQGIPSGLGITPRLGRQHFGALRNEHRRLTLHLGSVLQVFNGFDAVCQLHFQASQRFARQRGTRLGCIALPGQRVCQIQLAQRQQGLGLVSPLGSGGFLTLGALQVVELFLQGFCRTLVAIGQVFINLGHLFGAWLGQQPLPNARGTLA